MTIKPVGDRILVQLDEIADEQIVGGIIVPKGQKDKEGFQIGTVVSVGSGKLEDGTQLEFEVKIGDKILINKYGITDAKINNKVYSLVRYSEVIAIIE